MTGTMAIAEAWELAVTKASSNLSENVIVTPVIRSETIAARLRRNLRTNSLVSPKIDLLFKCENLQRTGSFKLRGATHFISQLSDSQLRSGLVAYSTGNHALAVACAAKTASERRNITVPCTVIMPTTASSYKISATKHYGANIILHGESTADGVVLAHKIRKITGATLVPPSGHEHIMLGQATVMAEFAAQVGEACDGPLDLVLAPSAGGALLAGTGIVCQNTSTIVIGTEPDRGGADLRTARETKTHNPSIDHSFTTIAEGLRSPTAEYNWEFLRDRRFVHDVFKATDEQIAAAMAMMARDLDMAIEPSSAVAIAVLLFNEDFLRLISSRDSWRIGVIISGGNIGIDTFGDLLRGADKF